MTKTTGRDDTDTNNEGIDNNNNGDQGMKTNGVVCVGTPTPGSHMTV
jgi:hypothetical protein